MRRGGCVAEGVCAAPGFGDGIYAGGEPARCHEAVGRFSGLNGCMTNEVKLTALDRCDACGAQAYVRVTLASGSELLFCAHHAGAHAEALANVAKHIHDETNRLTEPAAV